MKIILIMLIKRIMKIIKEKQKKKLKKCIRINIHSQIFQNPFYTY